MDLDRGAGLEIDVTAVPAELRGMITYIERWGFEASAAQDAFVVEMVRQRPAEVRAFNAAIDEVRGAITRWGEALSFTQRRADELSDQDWKSPYWAFVNALKIRELTGYEADDPEVLSARAKLAAEMRSEHYKRASVDADDAFRRGDFHECVSILDPYHDLLTAAQKEKLEVARRRSVG